METDFLASLKLSGFGVFVGVILVFILLFSIYATSLFKLLRSFLTFYKFYLIRILAIVYMVTLIFATFSVLPNVVNTVSNIFHLDMTNVITKAEAFQSDPVLISLKHGFAHTSEMFETRETVGFLKTIGIELQSGIVGIVIYPLFLMIINSKIFVIGALVIDTVLALSSKFVNIVTILSKVLSSKIVDILNKDDCDEDIAKITEDEIKAFEYRYSGFMSDKKNRDRILEEHAKRYANETKEESEARFKKESEEYIRYARAKKHLAKVEENKNKHKFLCKIAKMLDKGANI